MKPLWCRCQPQCGLARQRGVGVRCAIEGRVVATASDVPHRYRREVQHRSSGTDDSARLASGEGRGQPAQLIRRHAARGRRCRHSRHRCARASSVSCVPCCSPMPSNWLQTVRIMHLWQRATAAAQCSLRRSKVSRLLCSSAPTACCGSAAMSPTRCGLAGVLFESFPMPHRFDQRSPYTAVLPCGRLFAAALLARL